MLKALAAGWKIVRVKAIAMHLVVMRHFVQNTIFHLHRFILTTIRMIILVITHMGMDMIIAMIQVLKCPITTHHIPMLITHMGQNLWLKSHRL